MAGRRLFQLIALAVIGWLLYKGSGPLEEFLLAPIAMAEHVSVGFEMDQISRSLINYKVLNERFPRPEEFTAFMHNNFQSRQKNVTKDTWGTPYWYGLSEDGKAYRLQSAGPDKRFGTSDDLILHGKR